MVSDLIRDERVLPSAMPDDDHSAISAADAKRLFADWKAVPAIVLAVSGGPDSIALMWLAVRWRRALARGPRTDIGVANGFQIAGLPALSTLRNSRASTGVILGRRMASPSPSQS